MASAAPPRCQRQAFTYDLTARNETLAEQGMKQRFTSTGTTIVGAVFDGGVVIGADTRASAGNIVAEKNCMKVHHLAPNIYACGAGTAADCDHVTAMAEAALALERFEHGKETRMMHAETLLSNHLSRYQGYIGAHLILGGIDCKGPQLCAISNHGYIKHHTFLTMGSGSLAAQAILDSKYKDKMTEKECKDLVHEAVKAGVFNDLGSGGTINLCVLKRVDGKAKSEMLMKYDDCNSERPYQRKNPIVFAKGTTTILKEEIEQLFTVSSPMEVDA
eukprot:TRINITY_DN57710_c0_g1_i1.p1 TRINITY_DN57710_c0_g1~~TRINITY_DN57710_c0_g1_i1.p1  ORF type:complete len:292 (+),score=114.22 TRINITY_DN57710_c0_g1_i1:52-876(+)